MNWFETLKSGFEAIITHRLRSSLTVLGILIGITSVILTVGLGEGAQSNVSSAISSLGTNLLIVTPGSTTGPGGVKGGLGSASTLTSSDMAALENHYDAPDIKAVAPSIQKQLNMTSTSSNWAAPVIGTTPSYAQIRNRTMAQGSFITSQDVIKGTNVVVLGQTVATSLFPNSTALGSNVTISGVPFKVVGVLASSGSIASSNQDNLAIVPITTANSELLPHASSNSVQSIFLEASSKATLGTAYNEANNLLLNLHHITNPSQADFTITSQTNLLSTASTITQTLTFLLGGIAAISLLVGGIGVMNIMLVSVTERIREIGLRKALGATPGLIRQQFLFEALVLGLIGGVSGVVLGLILSLIIPTLIPIPIVISSVAIIGSVAVSATIGVVFGVYPASRAAKLSPIDALRSE